MSEDNSTKACEVEEQDKKLEIPTPEEQRLKRKEKELDAIVCRVNALEKQLADSRALMANGDASQVDRVEAAKKADKIQEELTGLKVTRDTLHEDVNWLTYMVKHKKHFDKRRVFNNIRELLKTKDEKLGKLETDGGSQPGYMSRLERDGNTSDPTIEFVVTAAKKLGVSVDVLINSTIGEITPTEKYLLGFLRQLIDDTRADNIDWQCQDHAALKNIRVIDYQKHEMTHPLFDFECETTYIEDPYEDVTYGEPERVFYSSRFFPREDVFIAGNCYVADLPNAASKIYLMNCGDSDFRFFYELYLVDDSVNPVCNSILSCSEVEVMMESLYKEIELAANHVHLNTNTKNIINEYLDHIDVPF